MRSPNQRINWFRTNTPSAVGMCLQHTWRATQIPAVGMGDANAGVAYVRKNRRMHPDRNPPRGAWVWWTSANHGHVALSLGDQRVVSTDVYGPRTVGTKPLGFFEDSWNQTYAGWSSWYGVPFTVGTSRIDKVKEQIARIRNTKLKPLRRLLDRLRRRDP